MHFYYYVGTLSTLSTLSRLGSVFFGWFGKFEVWFWRTNFGSGGSEFSGSFQYQIYPFFDILFSKNLWFSSRFCLFWEVRSLISEDETRCSEGSRLGFI